MTDDHMYSDNFSCTFESRLVEGDIDDVGEFVDTFDELIIACVQSYTHLYNKNDKNYKDHVMKEKSWEEIAKTCNVSVCEVQQRWKRLKDRYTKERRLNENATRSGSGMQQKKQWPLFESLKFLEKHIQRRRTFSNVPLQFQTKCQNNVSEELNVGHPNIRESTPIIQQSQNTAELNQEFRKIERRFPLSSRMESQAQKRFPEKQLEGLKRGFSNWRNCEPTTSKTLYSREEHDQSFTPLARTNTSDISVDSVRSTSSTSTYENVENTAVYSNRASDISACKETNFFPNALNTSHSVDEDVGVAQLSTAVSPSLPIIPKKCFSGNVQRKVKNKPDVLETSFVNATNAFKEYILEKRGDKENCSSADEHLAKFIVSRLSELPQENRDEKRKKLIDVLLSK